MEKLIQYGPYTPQELDRIINWLNVESIKFEIIRNDQESKEALMNDGQNIVNLVDLRTQVYLAQIFYLNINFENDFKKDQFEKKFTAKEEVFLKQDKNKNNLDDELLRQSSLSNRRKKQVWSLLLATLMILVVLFALIDILLK